VSNITFDASHNSNKSLAMVMLLLLVTALIAVVLMLHKRQLMIIGKLMTKMIY
jgi:hypothetical protein